MKRILSVLTTFLLISSAAWADAPSKTGNDREVKRLIFLYNHPQIKAEDLYKTVQSLMRYADAGQKLAQRQVMRESLKNDPHSDSKNGFIKKLKKSCEQKEAEACMLLAEIYTEGRFGLTDPESALNHYEKAADLGLKEAECHLGMMYWKGETVQKDDDKALEWIKKAAAHGDAECNRFLSHVEPKREP